MGGAICLSLLIALIPSHSWADDEPATLREFLRQPSAQSWFRLMDDGKAGAYGKRYFWLSSVFQFHEARLRRDLPNSMALAPGVSPAEHVRKQAELATDALKKLQK